METLYLGVDGAQIRTGIAWRYTDPIEGLRVGCMAIPDIVEIASFTRLLRVLAQRGAFERVIAGVEYPTFNRGASPVVRAANNAYTRALKAVFPKAVVIRVNPAEWQKAMCRDAPGDTTKERSIYRAGRVDGYPVATDPDMADASCILEYVRQHGALVLALKKKRRKPTARLSAPGNRLRN